MVELPGIEPSEERRSPKYPNISEAQSSEKGKRARRARPSAAFHDARRRADRVGARRELPPALFRQEPVEGAPHAVDTDDVTMRIDAES